jgi:hypothetical protein
MRKDFSRGRWKRREIAPKCGDLRETKAAMRYAPGIFERLIFFQRIAKHRLCFHRVLPGRGQCSNKGGVCLAKAAANLDIDTPRRHQLGLRAIEIIAAKC